MAMNDEQIVVGALIRPTEYRMRNESKSTIIGIDDQDVWIRPLDPKRGPAWSIQRQELHVGWEPYVEPDGTNHSNVRISDLFIGVAFDIGCGHGPVHLSTDAALNLAAWILRVLNPGLEWGDMQQAVAKEAAG